MPPSTTNRGSESEFGSTISEPLWPPSACPERSSKNCRKTAAGNHENSARAVPLAVSASTQPPDAIILAAGRLAIDCRRILPCHVSHAEPGGSFPQALPGRWTRTSPSLSTGSPAAPATRAVPRACQNCACPPHNARKTLPATQLTAEPRCRPPATAHCLGARNVQLPFEGLRAMISPALDESPQPAVPVSRKLRQSRPGRLGHSHVYNSYPAHSSQLVIVVGKGCSSCCRIQYRTCGTSFTDASFEQSTKLYSTLEYLLPLRIDASSRNIIIPYPGKTLLLFRILFPTDKQTVKKDCGICRRPPATVHQRHYISLLSVTCDT